MKLDLQALREAAEKATPGPWRVENRADVFGPNGGDSGDGVNAADNDAWPICTWHEIETEAPGFDGPIPLGGGCVDANLAHIAAFDPPTVLALLNEVERLRKRETSLYDLLNRCERDVQRAFREAKKNVGMGAVSFSGSGSCPYTNACKAIQQRAAGVKAPLEASA